jgi:hypothetical protein
MNNRRSRQKPPNHAKSIVDSMKDHPLLEPTFSDMWRDHIRFPTLIDSDIGPELPDEFVKAWMI